MAIDARWVEFERLLALHLMQDCAAVPAHATASVTSRSECPRSCSGDDSSSGVSMEATPGDTDCSSCSRPPSCGIPFGGSPSYGMPPGGTPSRDLLIAESLPMVMRSAEAPGRGSSTDVYQVVAIAHKNVDCRVVVVAHFIARRKTLWRVFRPWWREKVRWRLDTYNVPALHGATGGWVVKAVLLLSLLLLYPTSRPSTALNSTNLGTTPLAVP